MNTGKGMTNGRAAIQIAAVAADGRGYGCCLRQTDSADDRAVFGGGSRC